MASVYTVSQVNAYIRGMFAQDPALMRITVSGEVSNCKYHSTGHIYFTLKDSGGETISAVMFASRRSGLSFRLEDGQQVQVTGSIEVYVRNGTYSLYAVKIEHAGQGELYERFIKLKEKLEDMGLFDAMYKQSIPKYVRTVGVVTASTGAAIRDIINISSRRNPYVQLYLCSAQVQGHGAAQSIVRAIETLDTYGLDVMIVGRGGGSLEDLWAFNEEIVAKAIFDAKTPIISAVGHETDTTIADYVADLRAPTPSAAAELAVYDVRQLIADVDSRIAALRDAETALIGRTRDAAELRSDKLALLSPARRLNELRRRQDDARSRLVALMHDRLSDVRNRQSQSGRQQLNKSMTSRIKDSRHALALAAERMKAVSPLEKLTAGYVWVSDADDEHIRSVSQVHKGDTLNLRWADGGAKAQITQTWLQSAQQRS